MFGLTGIWRFIIPGVIALGLIAVIVLGINSCKKLDAEADNQLINSGIAAERAATQGEVINHVNEAQDAVSNPTANDLSRVCSKYDRNCPTGN